MESLVETRQALYELRASEERGFGVHLDETVAVGTPGIVVGEIPFDPSKHAVEDINHFSMHELMTDIPHVTQVVPYRPLEMSVVLHQDPRERQINEFLQPIRTYKRQLALELKEAIFGARQVTDGANLYVVGDTDEMNGLAIETQVITDTEEPEAAAEVIADICRRGLTFVISNFDQLPLEKVISFNGSKTIAVKANHEYELAIPAKRGGWPMGRLWEVNTGNRKQLGEANEQIAQRHADIENSLGRLGLALAKVVYRNNPPVGLNVDDTDRQIASAVRTIGQG